MTQYLWEINDKIKSVKNIFQSNKSSLINSNFLLTNSYNLYKESETIKLSGESESFLTIIF